MEFGAFLSADDAQRAQRTFATLCRHSIAPLVLTGGFAIELHRLRAGFAAQQRPLNDIDFLVDRFDQIPTTLSKDLLLRHVHPHDPPARTLLQAVDPETAIRVDIFRAYGNMVARAVRVELSGANLRMISLDDLAARTARLCMDLAQDTLTPAKHTRDFLRLLPMIDVRDLEPIWREHRKPGHPASFAEAAARLTELNVAREDLQIVPV
jgi:hypothetical protein